MIPDRAAWLERLPETVSTFQRRWSLTLDPPFDHDDVSCAWAAPAILPDGTHAVLKIGMPHFEAQHEIEGLRFWNGDPTVSLLDSDESLGAMLLERCEPGIHLRALPEPEQDAVIAELLRRLWRTPPPGIFQPLSVMLDAWAVETLRDISRWPDPGLVREGLRLFAELPRSAPAEVLLATDLHAGNVLSAARRPWLVIDPKPFLGDPCYDATQHLFNCKARLAADPHATIRRLADLLELDATRIGLWTFARAAAEPRSNWTDPFSLTLARALAP